ncbi:hypothetical protein SAMN04487996_104323 [Dyadobacter soli]|uniref:Uncharacterized protein n=1 Tax=Dyadobacter soli TaxID=659014 RepID=A0A1G7BVE5_9BACT|nr:hypothetical protein SAMN04487996_104323 [Dyadobacter soli]
MLRLKLANSWSFSIGMGIYKKEPGNDQTLQSDHARLQCVLYLST